MSKQCKDCVHYDVCNVVYPDLDLPFVNLEKCRFFKDKSLFVELPCKVGTQVWWIDQGKIYKCHFSIADMCGAYGETVFLTREEAEKALKERE